MNRPLLGLLLASLNLGVADPPAGRVFLMLGGITQIVDAGGSQPGNILICKCDCLRGRCIWVICPLLP